MDTLRLKNICEFPPKKPFKIVAAMEVDVHRPSIYVAGKYLKLERGLSQTPWSYSEPGASSVQEIISEHLAPHFKCVLT